MNEQENPFKNKDIDKEIDNILSETPLEEPKSKPQLKTKVSRKKLRISKKKIILTVAVILFIVGAYFILIQKPCEPCNCDNETITTISNEDFINSLKQQIIDKGYAEINDGASIIKLSPYIK